MNERGLDGIRVLVVEDEYFLADDLCQALADAGAEVLGPIPTVEEAEEFVAAQSDIDAAILDINLHGEMVFPVADTLRARGVPFAFTSGYDGSVIPERFAGVPHAEKPFKGDRIMAILAPLIPSAND